jgi:GTPase
MTGKFNITLNKSRLSEGNGEAFYQLGVTDDGRLTGIR